MTSAFWPMIAALATAVAPAQAEPSFCQRMAAELPMKEKRVSGTVRAFDMQTLTATQRWLVGGTSQIYMRIAAVEGSSEEEEKRVDGMCMNWPCTIEGPFDLTLGLKNGASYDFSGLPSERARLEFVGTRLRCADL